VATLRAPVVSLRTVQAGDSVSYGATWHASTPARIATLGVGYCDGVPRSVHGPAQALLAGHRCPIVGRVTMDMVMVEVPAGWAREVRVGDVATLFGGEGEGAISLDEFAGWAGTISYEILTGLGSRLPREYRNRDHG
jgi:alanine racemase